MSRHRPGRDLAGGLNSPTGRDRSCQRGNLAGLFDVLSEVTWDRGRPVPDTGETMHPADATGVPRGGRPARGSAGAPEARHRPRPRRGSQRAAASHGPDAGHPRRAEPPEEDPGLGRRLAGRRSAPCRDRCLPRLPAPERQPAPGERLRPARHPSRGPAPAGGEHPRDRLGHQARAGPRLSAAPPSSTPTTRTPC